MGEYLNREQGFNALGIRLTGHATHPEDMIRSRYNDWQASVEDGFHLLSGTAKNIYLCGLSMGGILSLYSASRLPVKGVVAMSTPYKLPDDPRLKFIRLLSKVQTYMPKSEDESAGWFGDAWKDYHKSYGMNPLRSIEELNLLLGEMRAALPEGLRTEVGERGSRLSMGQRQLVSLMRVLVQRPAIFILDEATANIDPFTEHQIQQALELILDATTSVLIAHRLSTVQAADRIIVLQDGRIIEEGNHRSLLAGGGHYADLYNTYFRHQSLAYIEAARQAALSGVEGL